MKRISAIILTVAMTFGVAACRDNEPKWNDPKPKQITEKKIDPRKCAQRINNGKCAKWDDKDWVFVTDDGNEWDVDESTYKTYRVGDWWLPTNN